MHFFLKPKNSYISSFSLKYEIKKNKFLQDAVYSRVQLLWLSVHVFRLLLIVEPCHITYSEVCSLFFFFVFLRFIVLFEEKTNFFFPLYQARKTTSIVCAILRNCKDPNLRDSVRNVLKKKFL